MLTGSTQSSMFRVKVSLQLINIFICEQILIFLSKGFGATAAETYAPLPRLDKTYSISDSIINPYNFSFVINAKACSPDEQFLIIIHSSTKKRYNERRSMMRSTWLSPAFLQGFFGSKPKILFFLGLANNTKDQQRLDYESQLYGDIVQSSFVDSYFNNTYKAMSYLLWTSKYCSQAQLLLKMDDDVLLRVETLTTLVANMTKWTNSSERLYVGKIVADAKPRRNKKDKWYISKEVWPYETYPLWLQGMVYFLSPNYTTELFQAALRTSYMFTDDVFMGICVNKTAKPGQKTVVMNSISSFQYGKDREKRSLKDWDEGKIPFFHFPDKKLYMQFFYYEKDSILRKWWKTH